MKEKKLLGLGVVVLILNLVAFITVTGCSKTPTPNEVAQVTSPTKEIKGMSVSTQSIPNPQSASRIAFDQLVAETNGKLFEFKKDGSGKLYATPLHVTAQWLNKEIQDYFTVSQIGLNLGAGGVGANISMGSLYNSMVHDCSKRPPGSPEMNRCDSQLKSMKLAVLAAESGVTLGFVDTKESLERQDAVRMTERKPDLDAIANLQSLYVACKVYWYETTSENSCSIDVVENERYQFIKSKDVEITISSAKEKSFAATARHTSRQSKYSIDANGRTTYPTNAFS